MNKKEVEKFLKNRDGLRIKTKPLDDNFICNCVLCGRIATKEVALIKKHSVDVIHVCEQCYCSDIAV